MPIVSTVLIILSFVSVAYWVWALHCAIAFARRRAPATAFTPPVSILKPLCGDHPSLYENLVSFCEQDYPCFQIVFGVRDADDPATHVVRRLMADFPALDLALVADDRLVGTNPKISNVVNLYKSAKHDIVVLADSDIRVERRYLRAVVAPLGDGRTGLVTCLYRASALGGLPSILGAMFINEWFFPSALVATRHRLPAYAFGATIACRRDALESVGGFESVKDYVADDYMLGRTIAGSGRRIEVAGHVVDTTVHEAGLKALLFHELRWARTIRSVRPLGYSLSVVTFGLPLSLLALACGGVNAATLLALAGNVAVRYLGREILLHAAGAPPSRRSAGLVLVRDTLSLLIWLLSFAGWTVRWCGQVFTIDRHGRLRGLTT